MRVRLDSMAWLNKRDLTYKQELWLREELKFGREEFDHRTGSRMEREEPLTIDRGDWLGVPREYYLTKMRRADHGVVDRMSRGGALPSPIPDFNGTLRDLQVKATRAILKALPPGQDPPTRAGALLCAKTGVGKTVMACWLMAQYQLPTLVIVHKDVLVDQWRKELEQFLPGLRVGIVQADRAEYEGYHVAIGMIQSLSSKEYPDRFWSWPGLVVLDEAHRMASEKWGIAARSLNSRWRIGLTATPRRKDKAEKYFLTHIGPIECRISKARLQATVGRVWTDFELSPSLEQLEASTGKLNFNKLLAAMMRDDRRNATILQYICRALVRGRTPLVTTLRREHVDRLEEMYEERGLALMTGFHPDSDDDLKRLARQAYVGDPGARKDLIRRAREEVGITLPPTGRLMGGVSDTAIAEAKAEARVLWATTQYVSEGFDMPRLDTLLLTMPISDPEQVAGRILRPYEGKSDPVVLDFRDDAVGLCFGMAMKRERVYRKMNLKGIEGGTRRVTA